MKRLFILGTNHRLVDPTELGKLPPQEKIEARLGRLHDEGELEGYVLLSTCNRIELYLDLGDTEKGGGSDVLRIETLLDLIPPLRAMPRIESRGLEAARHLIRVAGSLESMVLGENQILGQVKRAWQGSVETGRSCRLLDEVFRQAVTGAKAIHAKTGLGSRPVSVASLAARHAAKWLGKNRGRTVRTGPRIALIGAGTMIRKAAPALKESMDLDLLLVNRTVSRAVDLRNRFGGTAMSLDSFLSSPPDIEGAFIALRRDEPLVREGFLQKILAARTSSAPLLLVDLCVPPMVDPGLGHRRDVHLLCMDRLKELCNRNLEERRSAARLAEPIAEHHVRLLEERLKARNLDLASVRIHHVELARKEADALLSREFRDLPEEMRERLRTRILGLAKAHAHLHLKDLKAFSAIT